MTLVFIAGSGRSGTTLLGRMLGQAPGWYFIGETVSGFDAPATRLCGCGARVRECAFWADIRQVAAGPRPSSEPELFPIGRLARWRHLPRMRGPRRAEQLASTYGEAWGESLRQFAAAAAASGAEILVDSSKSVPYGRVLGLSPGIELYVVHIVRDARAVIHSRKRWKPAPDRFNTTHMGRQDCLKSAAFWLASNLGAERFIRPVATGYVRVRYEDLIARPGATLDMIFRMVVGRPVELPLTGDRIIELGASHSVRGNPDRMRTGPIELRLDDEWTRRLAPRDRLLATALTWPLLLRYGYRIGRRGAAADVGVSTGPRRP